MLAIEIIMMFWLFVFYCAVAAIIFCVHLQHYKNSTLSKKYVTGLSRVIFVLSIMFWPIYLIYLLLVGIKNIWNWVIKKDGK